MEQCNLVEKTSKAKSLPDFKPKGTRYESINYGINNYSLLAKMP